MCEEGMFIVLEGSDDTCLDTQANLLAAHYRDQGQSVVDTGFPSKGPAGALLKMFYDQRLRFKDVAQHAPIQDLLWAADILDHLNEVIIPALDRGHIVICKRYIVTAMASSLTAISSLDDTTYQYRSDTKEKYHKWRTTINRFARCPDKTFFIHKGYSFKGLGEKAKIELDQEAFKDVRELVDGTLPGFDACCFDVMEHLMPLMRFEIISGNQKSENVCRNMVDIVEAFKEK